MMENNNDFKVIRSKNLAVTVSYISHEDFFTYDDKFDDSKKVYSFRNTEKFQKALDLVLKLRNKEIEL